ncbi:MAG: hypothetical protein MK165_15780 [Pirellulaceae bacterium]|nr:hypothetical protein [Pirellulaceae bacterium]
MRSAEVLILSLESDEERFMQARDLIDFAAMLATQCEIILERQTSFNDQGLHQYWLASKCRFQNWFEILDPSDSPEPSIVNENSSVILRPYVEEVLLGEVLTRIWAAIGCAYDAHRPDNAHRQHPAVAPIVRNVYAMHQQGRHRLLTLMASHTTLPLEDRTALDHLRRRCERWNDILLGHVMQHHDVSEFAFSPAVAVASAEDARRAQTTSEWYLKDELTHIALDQTLDGNLLAPSPNQFLNHQILAGIIESLGAEVLDTTELLPSVWIDRVTHLVDDAQELVDSLLLLDEL